MRRSEPYTPALVRGETKCPAHNERWGWGRHREVPPLTPALKSFVGMYGSRSPASLLKGEASGGFLPGPRGRRPGALRGPGSEGQKIQNKDHPIWPVPWRSVMTKRMGSRVIGLVLAGWVLGLAVARADEVAKVQSACAAQLLEELQGSSSKCSLLPSLLLTQGRYALVDIHVRCVTPGSRGPEVSYRKGCHVVLDRETYTIVGESMSRQRLRPIGILEIDGQPLILVERLNRWVLVKPDGSEAMPYDWECPEGKCLGWMSHQVRLIDRGVFPSGPLRVAVLRPEDSFLLAIYDLYPADEGQKRGRVQVVDRLVPREGWGQEWLRVTNLEEEMKRLFLHRSILQKLADLALGIDWQEELKKSLRHRVEGAPRGMTLFYQAEQGFFLATQQPLTVTHVDPASRSFQVLPPRGLGPLQPISLASSLVLTGLYPDGKEALWGLVHGGVSETETQYALRHPGQACPSPLTLPNGQKVCVFFVDLLVRMPLEDLGAAEWWILHEGTGKDDPTLLVLRVEGDAVEYLEGTPSRDIQATYLRIKRRHFR